MEGRQILDGILLTKEMIHSLKKTKMLGMMIKVDLAKAYDRVRWKFLKEVLREFGFQHDWTSWIGNLVSTAFFSILVNGAPMAPFNVTRGIWQEDPLSPFLFILLVDGLGRVLKAKRQEGKLSSLKPYEGMQAQTHQQFVDDTMLMAMASVREAKAIKQTLEAFKRESGLEVNKDKSQFFYFNTPQSLEEILPKS